MDKLPNQHRTFRIDEAGESDDDEGSENDDVAVVGAAAAFSSSDRIPSSGSNNNKSLRMTETDDSAAGGSSPPPPVSFSEIAKKIHNPSSSDRQIGGSARRLVPSDITTGESPSASGGSAAPQSRRPTPTPLQPPQSSDSTRSTAAAPAVRGATGSGALLNTAAASPGSLFGERTSRQTLRTIPSSHSLHSNGEYSIPGSDAANDKSRIAAENTARTNDANNNNNIRPSQSMFFGRSRRKESTRTNHANLDDTGTQQLPMASARAGMTDQTDDSSAIKNNNPRRATLLASRLASRTVATKSRFTIDRKHPSVAGGRGGDAGLQDPDRPHATRRYKPGDNVLVCNLSRWSTLVNRHGFPPGEGATPEEMRGPYIYAMATVKTVHFEEFAAYYTVTRADTGAEQRADADFMEPIRTIQGEQAAFRAAMQSSLEGGDPGEGNQFVDREIEDTSAHPRTKFYQCLEYICLFVFLLILPFLWIYDYLVFFTTTCFAPVWRFLKSQARLYLYGLEPYACQARLTMVNVIVICSFWYMFIDQARLAFFPPQSDHPVAILNFIMWVILLAELACEVFIRPDGYKSLITSEKAFSPQTVRYMNKLHLVVEVISLALFVPEFFCIFTNDSCSERFSFSFMNAALMAVTGPTRKDAFLGRCYFALVRLRVFGLVRHWKNMWITTTFLAGKKRVATGFFANIFPQRPKSSKQVVPIVKRQESNDVDSIPSKGADSDNNDDHEDETNHKQTQDSTLTNASNIGTALMVTNSYRAIALLWVITGLFPVFTFSLYSEKVNNMVGSMTEQLQATNLIADDTSEGTCSFLLDSVYAWLSAVVAPDVANNPDEVYLVKLDLSPYRCNVTVGNLCAKLAGESEQAARMCAQRGALANQTLAEQADSLGVRVGSLVHYFDLGPGVLNDTQSGGTLTETLFSVSTTFDETYSIQTAALGSLLLQFILLLSVLGGLSVLRRDAEVLVLGPLRRMLKIVARYAENPLVVPRIRRVNTSRHKFSLRPINDEDDYSSSSVSSESSAYEGGRAWRNDQFALGSYETAQLIAAVTKITDLLRKCWGVAGADIISTNLATREGALAEVFNPTVPGKSVYALFAFAAINDFDHALRNLGGDVMILINDVAAVLHGEVFRWGFGDSGQCNKNLGGAFLMVFRIGLVKEVIKKLEQATDVIFSGSKGSQSKVSQALTRRRANKIQQQQSSLTALLATGQSRRPPSSGAQSSGGSNVSPAGSESSESARKSGKTSSRSGGCKPHPSYRRLLKIQRSASTKAMSLSLASLPGISTFTDRAVIGMLKAYASIHRDNKLRSWNNDFRLGAGVGAFTVSMIYGMDAGWAVEGAVGSEYKIDATYLSPHVNMASRMMSACKQYGVTILLSQAVEELMSDVARTKLRHLDTVTVKGSSVKQKIFTYDARSKGADFFLFSRTDDQADVEAERYAPNIWNTDPDLNAMRQHVTDEFLHEFEEGRKMFLLGEWAIAKRRLEKANELMVENAIEGGYLEDELEQIRNESMNPTEAADELKRHNGDGPSQYLLNFMNSRKGIPPKVWEGWHPLNRK